MPKKLIRITTIPLSLEKLLEGQLTYMNHYYEVTAVAAEKDRLEKYGRKNGVKTFWVEMTRAITPIKDIKAVWKLYNYFKKEEPDIVHTHTPKAGIVGMLAAKMAGVPVRLHTVAGLPLLETTGNKRKVLNAVEKFTYKLATKVYPNSRGLQDIILKEEFANQSKLKVLGKGSSNGIDTGYFNPSQFDEIQKRNKRHLLGIPQEDFIFIFIGRLVSEKGINELVEAFKSLQAENKNISLLLVGPFEKELDPLKEETFKTIQKHEKVFTTGYQEDVRPYLAISNALAFPSYREGFPNVVMQAGAMNLPAIVSNINGCNEIIVEGINGVIIPVKDTSALFTALKLFVENKNYTERLSSNARDEICKYYERKEYWQLLLKEYKSLEQEYIKS
ncbi:glycosyl transferase family 1 [Salegentibacter salinarum]|uniref:Glycosyl transferase family 1 n=1 Tax=Salegentibacter salinarum TaxID=447422 RepID=A0A2N0TPY1_9FLAO|nr:glycosyltransferase family 4 protein [Salegentibacter salinarum]PKD16766.1 glycosyl transferase family 1 [Salegentibacter salinarum]SKB59351.1 Glycosyltransferase involved in cell wall bisynthesis [Salegentibacter salinarum]